VVLAGYLLWMSVVVGLYFFVPSVEMAAWTAVGVGSTLAFVVGLRLNRPKPMGPWLLLGGAVLTYTVADFIYYLTLGRPEAGINPRADDVLYVVMFVLLTAGLLRLTRTGAAAHDRAALIDALIFMCGLSLLSWIFIIERGVAGPDADLVTKITAIAYPLADVAIIAMVARLVVAVRWTPAVLLLAVGAAGMLVSDVIYRLVRIDGPWASGGPVDLGWLAFYVCWGAAALHPSMRALTEPRAVQRRQTTALRLGLLALASMIPPTILLVEAITNRVVSHGVVIAIASAVMFLLVLFRLAGVAAELRAQIARERGLRRITTALVAATDKDGIRAALDAGVRGLLPPHAPYRLVLLPDDREQAHAGPPTGCAGLDDLAEPTLLPVASMPPAVAARLAPHPTTLACPLALAERQVGGSLLGILLVSAPEAALVDAKSTLSVLASQAALALDRVVISRELSRRRSEEYFRALVHNTADVILIVDDHNRIGYASPSAVAVFGEVELSGSDLLDLLDEADRAKAGRTLAQIRAGDSAVDDRDATEDEDWTVRRRDDSLVQVEVSCRDLRDEPTVRGLVVTLRDVTEQRRLERELTHRAYHDALTGLANRVLFAERVQDAIGRAGQRGDLVGVLFIDLDDFKVVNDTLGHDCGDQLLMGVARRLAEALRHHDTAARLGGDEFAALIEDAHDVAAIEEVADRIAAALREPFILNGQLVTCAASIGVGTTADATNGQDLLRQADLALYVAKGSGKGQWRRYQPDLHIAIVERLALRADLDQAVHDKAFALEFQPIVALDSGHTSGFEALVRWDHPTRGRLLPDEFIDVAEESGLVVPIGDWVLRAAITAAARWRDQQSGHPPYVSINVSAWQFRSPGFVARVRRELSTAGLPPRCLMLEITESLLLRDDDQVWDDLTELRQIGVRVAIDDFGTGYSSLSYLRHVPLDVLKIDRLFTGTISSSKQQRALVDGIVRLAHTLGLEVVAEGIETAVERDLLARIGCPYGQGYLFSRPMELERALTWLRREAVAV